MAALCLIVAIVCCLLAAFGMDTKAGIQLGWLGVAAFATSFLLPMAVGYVTRRDV